MKVIWIILTICLLLSANLVLCGQESSNLLSSAIYEEEINGDLKKAMNLYEQIVNKYPEERSVAAESLLRLGIACEKLGRTRAQEYYQKILSNYPDQTNFVKSAQLRLQRIKSFLATKFPSNSTLLAPTFPKMFKSSKVYYPGMAVRSISPDGRYLSQVSALGNLAIYDRIKNEIRKLTPDPINKDKGRALGAKGLVSMSTIWSPDSKK